MTWSGTSIFAWWRPLLLPVTVTFEEPVLERWFTVTVRVAVPALAGDTLRLLAESVAEIPRGRLPTLRWTIPLNPFEEVTVSAVGAVGLDDLLTVRLAGFAVMTKDPPGTTVTETGVE